LRLLRFYKRVREVLAMKAKLWISLCVLLAGNGVSELSFAEDASRKVLVLGVLEENWDNIEIVGVMDRLWGSLTKTQLLQNEQGMDFGSPTYQPDLKQWAALVSTATEVLVVQNVVYLANSDSLADTDLIDGKIGRLGRWSQVHLLEEVPGSVSLKKVLTKDKSFARLRHNLSHFRWMRDVGTVSVARINENGAATVRYRNQTLTIVPGASEVLQDKRRNVSARELEFDDIHKGLDPESQRVVTTKAEATGRRVKPVRNPALTKEMRQGKKVPSKHYIRTRVKLFNLGFQEF
jgi:hypothetical protein